MWLHPEVTNFLMFDDLDVPSLLSRLTGITNSANSGIVVIYRVCNISSKSEKNDCTTLYFLFFCLAFLYWSFEFFVISLYCFIVFFFSVVFLLTHCLIFIQALFDRGDYIICNLLSIAELKRLYDCDSICRDFSLPVLLNRLFHYIVCSSYLHI